MRNVIKIQVGQPVQCVATAFADRLLVFRFVFDRFRVLVGTGAFPIEFPIERVAVPELLPFSLPQTLPRPLPARIFQFKC